MEDTPVLTLPIYISNRSISIIETALSRSLPVVSQHQRREALARGLGLSSSAALHESLISPAAGPVVGNGQAFAACLARWDHQVNDAAFYNAAALSALDVVAGFLPLLGRSGYGSLPPGQTAPDGFVDADRTELAEAIAVPGFLQAVHFLQSAPRMLGKRPRACSYSLKHLAERHSAAWSDGSRVGTGYVTNGELIAAGIYLGFEWEHDGAHGSRDILLDVDLRQLERGERTAARRSAARVSLP
jgi:hypothetical protein